eukprot:3379019-Pleurochrysis_carterae.AAC.4
MQSIGVLRLQQLGACATPRKQLVRANEGRPRLSVLSTVQVERRCSGWAWLVSGFKRSAGRGDEIIHTCGAAGHLFMAFKHQKTLHAKLLHASCVCDKQDCQPRVFNTMLRRDSLPNPEISQMGRKTS